MSQERTRFPIQPKERHRSAKSSKDIRQAQGAGPSDPRAQGKRDQDKPVGPPRKRKAEE